MKKQFAVFGSGNFGASVALTLQEAGGEVIAVDTKEERVQWIADRVSYAMRADVGDPDVLRSMGTRNLDGVVVAIAENMEASIMATIMSKELGVPMIIAKASNEMHEKILKKVGADVTIYPERETGERVAKGMMSRSFIDQLRLSSDYSIIETQIPKRWVGKSLADLNLRERRDISVVGIILGDKMEVNPDPRQPLAEGSILVMLGQNASLAEFQA